MDYNKINKIRNDSEQSKLYTYRKNTELKIYPSACEEIYI